MSYTTVDAVATYLNLDPDALSDLEQAQFDLLIPYVDGVIDSYCGYCLGAEDYEEKRYNGSGSSALDLGVYPVNTLESLRERQSDGSFIDYTDSVELLTDGTVQFLPSIGGTFTTGNGNIFISFNAGHTVIPKDIGFAATYLVALNFSKVTDNLIGIKAQTATNITTEYDSVELPLLVKRVLDRYRKLSIL